jgi:hypothetical protein
MEETSVNAGGKQGTSSPPAFMLISCSAFSSTLKVEAICYSETLVEFQRTTWRYMPEDNILINIYSKIMKYHKYCICILYINVNAKLILIYANFHSY